MKRIAILAALSSALFLPTTAVAATPPCFTYNPETCEALLGISDHDAGDRGAVGGEDSERGESGVGVNGAGAENGAGGDTGAGGAENGGSAEGLGGVGATSQAGVSGGTLAFTGLDLLAVLASGGLLIGIGLTVSRLARRPV